MIGTLQKNTMIEEAALEGDLNLVKQLVAMHKKPFMVSGTTLADLLSKQMLQGDSNVHFTDIALYLMENASWCQTDVENKLKALGVTQPFKIWKVKGSVCPSRGHGLRQVMLRCAFAEQALLGAIEADDVDEFMRVYHNHFCQHNMITKVYNYLPESFMYEFQEALLDKDLEDVNEEISSKIKFSWPIIINSAFRSVNPTKTLFLAKFIELGIDVFSFEELVGQSIEQWCEQNSCSDLLEIDEVKQRIAKQRMENKVKNLIESKSYFPPPVLKKIEERDEKRVVTFWPVDSKCNPYFTPDPEDVDMIKNYLKTYFSADPKLGIETLNSFCKGSIDAYNIEELQKLLSPECAPHIQAEIVCAFRQYNELHSKQHNTFWEWAAYVNQAELLSMPHVLPTSGITCMLNKAIVNCAQLGKAETLAVLIKHAKLYMPDALRFSKVQLESVESSGHAELAEKLRTGRQLKTTPAQSLADHAWSTLNALLEVIGEQEQQPESYSRLCL